MTKTIDIAKAKTQLPRLLSLALKGNEVIINYGRQKATCKNYPCLLIPKDTHCRIKQGQNMDQ